MVAAKAFEGASEFSGSPQDQEAQKSSALAISQRLQTELYLAQGRKLDEGLVRSFTAREGRFDAMTTLNCLDSATTQAGLDACIPEARELKEPWARFFDNRQRWNGFRIAVNQGSAQELLQWAEQLPDREDVAIEPMTGLDYRAEIAFLKALRRNGGNFDGALLSLKEQFPDFQLRN